MVSHHQPGVHKRGLIAFLLCWGLTACTHLPVKEKQMSEPVWAGRLMVEIQSVDESLAGAPPVTRTTHVHFEWTGHRQEGRLDLLTPLGQVVARANWSSQGAWLWTSQGASVKEAIPFPSLDALIEKTLGVPIPVDGLMWWLDKRHWPAESVFEPGVSASATARAGWQLVRTQNDPPSLELSSVQPERRYRVRLVLDEQ
jgi:outer membrane biogenesis lipoprotein LolB